MAEKDSLTEKVELLTDDYAKKILTRCYQEPKAAQQLSWESNIPIAAVYRRLSNLENAGFIEENVEGPGGNEASKYVTSLKKAELTFKDGKFSIKLKLDEEEITSEI